MDIGVLVIGEALIDIVEGSDGDRELVGGSPANVAVGVARQRHAVQLLTRLGRDDRGFRIADELAASLVRIVPESWTDAPTSTARARLRADGSAEYEFAIAWEAPVVALGAVGAGAGPGAGAAGLAGVGADSGAPAAGSGSLAVGPVRAVHTGSIALFLEPGGTAVLETLRGAAGRVLVSVDPNIRPALVGDHATAVARFADAAASADLVKLSDEDAAWLYPGLGAAEVLERIAGYGPRLAVMTRGADGAVGLGPGGIVEVAPHVVTVADTIGAGDAYMASLISSALDEPAVFTDGDAFAAALHRAAVMAGITVSRAGANPPTRAELAALGLS